MHNNTVEMLLRPQSISPWMVQMTNIEVCPLSVYRSASNHPLSLLCSTLPRDHHCQNSLYRKVGVQEGNVGRDAAGGEDYQLD
jgi:hypothetical protein